MRKIPFLYPILLAAASPLILYVVIPTARVFIRPIEVLVPILIAEALCGLFELGAYWLTGRNPNLAGLMAALFLLGLLYIWPLFLVLIGTGLLGLGLMRLVFHRLTWVDANRLFLLLASLAAGYYGFLFFSFAFQYSEQPRSELLTSLAEPTPVQAEGRSLPDIYYIILDGYGRADMLEWIDGYDNSAFTNGLEARGFFVASQSRANYPRTLLSLASSLNMQYLEALTSSLGGTYLWWPAMDALRHSQVRQILEDLGYRTVALSSGWDFTDLRDSDVYLSSHPIMLRDFSKVFIQSTNLSAFSWIEQLGISYPSYHAYRRTILWNFETLPEVASLPGPKFVFAHIVSPHPPYVFDRDGNPVNPVNRLALFGSPRQPGGEIQSRQAYLDQLIFINALTLEAIDGILARSETPPIIVIQGDHGPDIFMDFSDPTKACLYERYSILNAYYLPGVDRSSLQEDISPVNSFRLIFDHYFSASYDLLPDRSFYAADTSFYQFQDVTYQAGQVCDLPAELEP